MIPTNSKDDLDELIPLLLGIARLIHSRLSHSEKHPEEIFSPVQWHVLYFIEEKGDPSMKDLAEYLSITPPSATSLIDGLTKLKMLKRNFDKDDRRVVKLAITNKGKSAIKKGFNRMSAQIKKVLTCLNKNEQKQLIFIYQKVLNSLSN